MPHVQIRNVPPELHRRLRTQAARQGTSLNDYLLGQLEQIAALPTNDEIAERIRARSPRLEGSAADLIRADRDGR
jgi:plasmid stability protein